MSQRLSLEKILPQFFVKHWIASSQKFQRSDARVPLFSDLFLPSPFLCPGCSESHWVGICRTCEDQIQRCESIMLSPLDGIEGIAPLFFSFTPAHAMLTHWKDHGGTHLEEKLFLMSEGLKQELKAVEFDFILSVPQRLDRNWERGHSSSLKTAHFFSRMVGRPVRHTLELNSKVSSVKQASQDQWGRHFSENPFQFAEPYSTLNRNVLLVDDLVTSGATLLKACDAIREKLPYVRIWAGCLGYRPKRQ